MCDYSLENVTSRVANVADNLISTRFPDTFTRGFVAVDDMSTAVCVPPGTELAFDAEPHYEDLRSREVRVASSKLARFRQIECELLYEHHDALEFPDGSIVRVTRLIEGQRATVLQLPVTPESHQDEWTFGRALSVAKSEA